MRIGSLLTCPGKGTLDTVERVTSAATVTRVARMLRSVVEASDELGAVGVRMMRF